MHESEDIIKLKAALSELQHINNILDKISRIRETNHILSIIIQELIELTDADQGVVNLVSELTKAEPVTIIRKNYPDTLNLPFKINDLIIGWVLKNKRQLIIDDADNFPEISGLYSEGGLFKSIICSPMVVRNEIIGLVSLVRSENKEPFDDSHTRLAGIITSQSGQILSNALLLEELAEKNKLLQISQERLQDENIRLRTQLGTDYTFENIIGNSGAMRKVKAMISRVSGSDAPVLITGHTGTGKELVARAIHYNSIRKNKPFIVKNCGVKTESLLEAELFGYVKGAFTGAEKDKPGLFNEADGGSIFLDEIGDAPLPTQVAVLRVIENGEIRPVGATKTDYVNVRVISATNKNLSREIEQGTFRQDLFYRLNTFTVDLPPLKDRTEDIPLLIHHFLKQLKVKLGLDELSISPEALDILVNYSWPGNIRQLENEIERAAVVCEKGDRISISDLSPQIIAESGSLPSSGESRGQLKDAVEKLEIDLICQTLKKNEGNILRSAEELGLTRKGLKDKMARYGIEPKNSD